MSRPKGIIETKPRKPRSDRGKKRRRYAGKLVVRKKQRYDRRIGQKDSIIIWVQQKKKMTKDGRLNWKPWLRPKLYKETCDWKSTKPIRVNVSEINTREKMEDYIARNYWSGDNGKLRKFNIMGVSHGKTKTHFKWVKICSIGVKETSKGNVGKIISNKRLSKYKWFYRG